VLVRVFGDSVAVSVQQQSPQQQVTPPNSETLHRLSVDAAGYLGIETGDPLPIDEIVAQGLANGYTEDEIRALIEQEYSTQTSIPVPEQGDIFGKMWAVEDSTLNNTVSTGKDSTSVDEDECDSVEPLDGEKDFLAIQEPVARDGATCHPEYVADAEPLLAGEAIERYVEERHGESTSADRHGYRGRQWYDNRNYKMGKEMDRQLLEAYENPTTALISLRVERVVPNRVSLLTELSDALTPTLNALRYRLNKHLDRWEWMLVLAGTSQYATPHAHIYVWTEGDVSRKALAPVVERFVESCEYAPSDMRGNSTEGDTISIRGTKQTNTIPRTDDGGSAGATYALTQLAHLADVDSMDFDSLLWASTVRASERINHFRKSKYDVWDGGEEPEAEEFVEDFSPNTVSSHFTQKAMTEQTDLSDDESRFDCEPFTQEDSDSDSSSRFSFTEA
jgi:hypothetical protein